MAAAARLGAAESLDHFTPGLGQTSPTRMAITAAWRLAEPAAVSRLVAAARVPAPVAVRIRDLASTLTQSLRDGGAGVGRAGIVQGLLQQFSLSSQEGVALMCLAEALLRIPDSATRDALIRDKVAQGEWEAHLGKSPSLFVNAATWGLLLTGKLVATHSEARLSAALARLIGKGGEPLVRKGVDMAMRMLGEQFVTGETIADALDHARHFEQRGFRYSYDMLGEGAVTLDDARRYLDAYEQSIHAIGRASAGRGVYEGPGISIKLSALHPRYTRAQYARVRDELYPSLHRLALLARHYDIGLNIDAEESDRLELSLDLLERLCAAPELAAWNGIGFVIQAYQKRCPFVVEHLIDLARRSGHRLMVRLVKGAYWDSEIKRTQIDGADDYPVYTRKTHTDVSYIACARMLLAAPDAVYPQFATHNAQTLATIYELAGSDRYTPGQYEFQCLHGMGEPLYEQVVGPVAQGKLGRPCRIYAPVGAHETLLPYLVRRLLENGANTSFVNRIADPSFTIDSLVEDPVQAVEQQARRDGVLGAPHPAIALPRDLFGAERRNSRGLDLANDVTLATLAISLRQHADEDWSAEPMLADDARDADRVTIALRNPADQEDGVGHVQEATEADVDAALGYAIRAAEAWTQTPPVARAAALECAADALEADMSRLIGLLMREAGKTCGNGVGEVREAVDFLRFYAAQVRREFANATHRPLGPVVCISPWNFALSIFTGQIAAALAAGNTVLAKPAEQTPRVAAAVVRLLWASGVPRAVLQLLPGRGETVGAQLVADARVQGVLFTGSTDVARLLQATLAKRLDGHGQPVTLIAETGGQNAMIADSSALAEQVVIDALASAFDSAGQRCSALRVLCVQEDVAERVLAMLLGAMRELQFGDPSMLATDVGPVIDADARESIERHIARMREAGCPVHQPSQRTSHGVPDTLRRGFFVPPTLIELRDIAMLEREVFGPVLHFLRYRRDDLATLLAQIEATGYGLTFGLHTRIDETIAAVVADARVGNVYVNRNMIGAVVGVQPFGGEGLSGTGPKAGGPLYTYRMLARPPRDAMARAMGDAPAPSMPSTLASLRRWATAEGWPAVADACVQFASESRSHVSRVLAGPTGERNTYSLQPRAAVLCLADEDGDRLLQLAAVCAVGSRAVWPPDGSALHAQLPADVKTAIDIVADWTNGAVQFDAVLHHGDEARLRDVCRVLAARSGPLVGVQGLARGTRDIVLERLVVERVVSVNTAAAGGNTSLMTIG